MAEPIYTLHVKPGVSFQTIAAAGFRILAALERTARRLKVDLTITCGCDGHPETDPHFSGEAYDIRSHDLGDKKLAVLREVLLDLADDGNPLDAPIATAGGLASLHFFGWVEHPNTENEHIHIQRRHGTTYP